jgi:hypothetical protein
VRKKKKQKNERENVQEKIAADLLKLNPNKIQEPNK